MTTDSGRPALGGEGGYSGYRRLPHHAPWSRSWPSSARTILVKLLRRLKVKVAERKATKADIAELADRLRRIESLLSTTR
jgi:hypothetical protein